MQQNRTFKVRKGKTCLKSIFVSSKRNFASIQLVWTMDPITSALVGLSIFIRKYGSRPDLSGFKSFNEIILGKPK